MIVWSTRDEASLYRIFLYRNNYKSKLGRNKTLSIPLRLDTGPAGMQRNISIVQPKPTIH